MKLQQDGFKINSTEIGIFKKGHEIVFFKILLSK